MTDPTSAASIPRRLIDPVVPDGLQALRTGLDLTRASQLTMLRLQLALHRSNRRTAMQALDTLLDIDAEMEGLAATIGGDPTRRADEAALSGFIGLQKAALSREKHALAGGDWPKEVKPATLAEPDLQRGVDAPHEPPPAPDAVEIVDRAEADPPAMEPEGEARAGRRLWVYALAIMIAVALIGLGTVACFRPDALASMRGIGPRIIASVSGG